MAIDNLYARCIDGTYKMKYDLEEKNEKEEKKREKDKKDKKDKKE